MYKDQTSPTVSVIIPTFNRANVLPQAINSVLAQSYQNFEIIIVDDCSKDNTAQIMSAMKDPRIRYIKHDINRGGSAARNTGIKNAQGAYVAFLDSDDEWVKDKLSAQIELFGLSPQEVGLIYTGFRVINEQNQVLRIKVPTERGDILNQILIANCIGTASAPLIRTGQLKMINGFDETLESCQDWDLYIRLAEICHFDYVKEPMVNYFQHSNVDRISNKKTAVISGHQRIHKKFEHLISGMSSDNQAKHLNYLGLKYFEVGLLALGTQKNWEAFLISKDVSYLLRLFKRMWTHLNQNLLRQC